MEKLEKIFLNKESQEKELFKADLRVDFIRHGERTERLKDELSEQGRATIENKAKEIVRDINKDKELIVLWTSAKKRCQQATEIIKDIFQKEGITMLKSPHTKDSLKSVEYTKEGMAELINQLGEITTWIDNWMEQWTAIEELPQGVEKPQELKKRVERLMTYLERIARQVQPAEDKKLHILCVLHEELFRDLLKAGYDTGTKKDTDPTYGERMRIDIYKSEPDKKAKFDLEYRNSKASLEFNKDTREFKKND